MGKSRNKGNQNARKYQTEEEAKEAHRKRALEHYRANKDKINAKRRKSPKRFKIGRKSA